MEDFLTHLRFGDLTVSHAIFISLCGMVTPPLYIHVLRPYLDSLRESGREDESQVFTWLSSIFSTWRRTVRFWASIIGRASSQSIDKPQEATLVSMVTETSWQTVTETVVAYPTSACMTDLDYIGTPYSQPYGPSFSPTSTPSTWNFTPSIDAISPPSLPIGTDPTSACIYLSFLLIFAAFLVGALSPFSYRSTGPTVSTLTGHTCTNGLDTIDVPNKADELLPMRVKSNNDVDGQYKVPFTPPRERTHGGVLPSHLDYSHSPSHSITSDRLETPTFIQTEHEPPSSPTHPSAPLFPAERGLEPFSTWNANKPNLGSPIPSPTSSSTNRATQQPWYPTSSGPPLLFTSSNYDPDPLANYYLQPFMSHPQPESGVLSSPTYPASSATPQSTTSEASEDLGSEQPQPLSTSRKRYLRRQRAKQACRDATSGDTGQLGA